MRGSLTLGRIGEYLLHGASHEIRMTARRMSRDARQRDRSRRNQAHASRLLRELGFESRFQHPERLEELDGGALIVANHLSFWDVLILASRFPCLFVTSVEVRDTPLLGWIARLGGCVFVERRDRSGINREISELVSELRAGHKVVLFPEGTSSNGGQVLPFKRSLFRAAVESGCPVVPICINYRAIDGKPIDAVSRDWLFYYGDQKFSEQLLQVTRLRRIVVELEILEPILPTSSPPDEHRVLCERSYSRIIARYCPIGEARP